jgi:hypothetical protein
MGISNMNLEAVLSGKIIDSDISRTKKEISKTQNKTMTT